MSRYRKSWTQVLGEVYIEVTEELTIKESWFFL